jgi:cytidine deaminase
MFIQKTNLIDELIEKRKAHYNASGYTSMTKSEHICAILKDGIPISYGVNVYNLNDMSTEHAEAQALRKLYERFRRRLNAKKFTIDILVIRINYGNSKPCARCINTMINYTKFFSIRNIYYSKPEEENGIRCVKFSKFISEDPHICSFDRNLQQIAIKKKNKN